MAAGRKLPRGGGHQQPHYRRFFYPAARVAASSPNTAHSLTSPTTAMAPASTESHLGRKLRSALDTVVHKAADAADAAEQQASKADGERKKKGCREVVTSAARSPAGSAVLTATAAYLTIRGGIEVCRGLMPSPPVLDCWTSGHQHANSLPFGLTVSFKHIPALLSRPTTPLCRSCSTTPAAPSCASCCWSWAPPWTPWARPTGSTLAASWASTGACRRRPATQHALPATATVGGALFHTHCLIVVPGGAASLLQGGRPHSA